MLVVMLRTSLASTLALVLALSLTACPSDDGGDEAADEAATESEDGSDASTDETTDDTTDGTEAETTEDETDDANPLCGNGVIDDGEVCDDGNKETEFPPYAAEDCMEDCSMVLATCNDGVMDPGEDCDDGNADSMDGCTTSCTINDMGVHAACTVYENGEEIDPQFNVSEGDIQNCDNVAPPASMAVGCNRSWEYLGGNLVYAAGGDCQMMSLKCEGGALCPAGPIGDYDADTTCPEGHVLVDKTIEGDGVIVPTIKSKVCLLACESDRECRWNEADAYWEGPGEYRCTTTPLSGGEKVCNDARNNEL